MFKGHIVQFCLVLLSYATYRNSHFIISCREKPKKYHNIKSSVCFSSDDKIMFSKYREKEALTKLLIKDVYIMNPPQISDQWLYTEQAEC